jgi:quercetin dioxygenase-like cupin family protein
MAEPYDVKSIEVLARGEGYFVRAYVYAPGQEVPWHRHSEVTDLTCCVSGEITLETAAGAMVLGPGERAVTPPGEIHRLANRGQSDCHLLLIQHGGRYDFLAMNPPTP